MSVVVLNRPEKAQILEPDDNPRYKIRPRLEVYLDFGHRGNL